MNILAYILSGFSLLMSVFFFIKPRTFIVKSLVLVPALTAGALSFFWALIGVAGAVIGWVYQALWAVSIGIISAGVMLWYLWQNTRGHQGFENAFGADWAKKMSPEQTRQLVQKRWSLFLKMKAPPQSSWERDVPFWTVPGTDRELLCDIWQPANGNASGLGLVFLHGSAWYALDKDFGTRPFFRHLVAQGHTIMDVSYRLCPEVDLFDMIGDVKHAVAWMKANASRFGVDPDKIVLGGASAGGHLALLAAYTPQHPQLTPEELKNTDLSVCGVFSYYGHTNLSTYYQFVSLEMERTLGMPPVVVGPDAVTDMKNFGRMDTLLGGHPHEVPHIYELASPFTHVQPGSPPTLLIHGSKDLLVPAEATNAHYAKLIEAGVPVINLVLPWTNHAFDLLLPQISPPAQSALFDVDRFLAVMLNKD